MKIDWQRSDPAKLAAFDPNTKFCTMNCSALSTDPRSAAERKFQCGDCMDVPKAVGRPLEGLSAYLRCKASSVSIDAQYRLNLLQWAAEVDALKANAP